MQRTVAAPTAREKFTAYAQGLVAIQRRLAPILLSLRTAAAADAECAGLWMQISEQPGTGALHDG